jgi:hypothetical protein
VALLAGEQHTVVSHEQLAGCGIRDNAITRRVKNGRLHRHYPCVYSVGTAKLTREGRWLAAVMACGPGAVLSHLDAAVLWGIHDWATPAIDVTTPRRSRAGVSGIRLHRVRRLEAADVTVRDAIPVTTVARTLVDLTDVVGRERLARMMQQADYLGLLDLPALDAAIARASGRKRLSSLRAAVEIHRPGTVVRSELEHRFLLLCRDSGIPAPETNVRITVGGRRVELDCLWRDQGVVVELDGAAAHATRRAFEGDRERDATLTTAGFTPMRFTWRRIQADPAAIASEVTRTLATAPRRPPPGCVPS